MADKDILREIESANTTEGRRVFKIGDTVNVHVRIKEGDKERVQRFSGTVIGRKGSGSRETFTVRRLVANQGVERTFPLNSPIVQRIDVTKRGRVRRAKLYYLRDRVGKATRVQEKRGEGLASTEDTVKKEAEPKKEEAAAK